MNNKKSPTKAGDENLWGFENPEGLIYAKS
jgi:hypothetical protein